MIDISEAVEMRECSLEEANDLLKAGWFTIETFLIPVKIPGRSKRMARGYKIVYVLGRATTPEFSFDISQFFSNEPLWQ